MGIDVLRVMGRATQGVRLINLRDGDRIASVTRIQKDPEEEVGEIENGLDPLNDQEGNEGENGGESTDTNITDELT